MVIYVVKQGDTIASIADSFGVSVNRLIRENAMPNPYDLVVGQTIVITFPEVIYTVREGDTLSEIALNHGIPIIQLYQNNPYLWDREYIYPDEELIIRYPTNTTIASNGYAFPFIDKNILNKTLPYLTYLSILNYKTLEKGEIESFYDDSELIETAKLFGVAPLMLVTSVTFRGQRNPEMVNEILNNPDYQVTHAQSMLKVLKQKGYYGVNITITYLNKDNQELYLNYLKRVTSYLNQEGYPVFVTIDPNFLIQGDEILFEEVNFSYYDELVAETYVTRFFWGTQYESPMPVSSVDSLTRYVNYMKQMINPNKISIGCPLLGYDWKLPYIEGFSEGNAITLDASIDLARNQNVTIQFDDISQTPYYNYSNEVSKSVIQHIVWFIDARTIDAIINLVLTNELRGTGLWNIMVYYPQLWLIIYSNCKIDKIFPELD